MVCIHFLSTNQVFLKKFCVFVIPRNRHFQVYSISNYPITQLPIPPNQVLSAASDRAFDSIHLLEGHSVPWQPA